MIDLVNYVDRCPSRGETVMGRDFRQGFGGKGANQAAMASLLGADVQFVTCIGEDAYTSAWLAHFATFGLDTSRVHVVDGAHSGTATIWVAPDGENMIVLSSGANAQLDRTRVGEAFSACEPVDVVLSQLEVPQAAIAEGFRLGKARGATTILNPGPASPLDQEILSLCDWLLPNETELRLLARTMCGLSGGDDLRLAQALAAELHIELIVTLGARGAAWSSRGAAPLEVAAPNVPVTDTTGAGDAFSGTFAFAMATGLDVASSIRLAVAVSADSVTRPGTAVSFSRGDDVRKLWREALGTDPSRGIA